MRYAITFALCVSAACSGNHAPGSTDDIVGAPCVVDTDCAHRCFTDNNDHFPGGFCSTSCTSDVDCPSDTACVDVAGGGVCMFVCPPFDCAFLGPGWRCDNRDRHAGGQIDVCIGG